MKTLAYYNEIDPFAAQWLRNLIDAELIAPGVVDERDIRDVFPDDLAGFRQCHFFAGIGGWSRALRLANWPDNKPVWTGSCPCQPFSTAGKQLAATDERHLWPAWFHLIQECNPAIIFGEQVEAAIGHGWLDLVCNDLEGIGYAVGAAVAPAAGVGAPHVRHRLWFVADSNGERFSGRGLGELQECSGEVHIREGSNAGGFWTGCDWIDCRDGKRRPVEPGTFPLAHGIPGRVGKIRAYGNAIVPQIAAEIIKATMYASSW